MSGATLTIRQDVVRRLDTLARRTGLTTTALANLFIEAAVNQAEQQLARDQRVVKELEAILVRAILRGEYDLATSVNTRWAAGQREMRCVNASSPRQRIRVPGSNHAKTYGRELLIIFQTLAVMFSTTFPKTMRGLQGAMR
jgi:hypothetical protein